MQGVGRYQVRLLPHDEAWEGEFEKTKAAIEAIWAENVVEIHHIGSTAIKTIWAKPVLDIAVVLHSFDDMDVAALTKIGYDYRGFQTEDRSRCLFVLRGENDLSLHHLHCYEKDDADLRDCLAFRDYLNAHPEEAEAYSALKKRLAELFADSRAHYSNGKNDFIQSILRKI